MEPLFNNRVIDYVKKNWDSLMDDMDEIYSLRHSTYCEVSNKDILMDIIHCVYLSNQNPLALEHTNRFNNSIDFIRRGIFKEEVEASYDAGAFGIAYSALYMTLKTLKQY